MDWIIITTVFFSVLKAALCFNIDPVAWQTLSNPAAGFGYQVVQKPSGLLVSAPLAQLSPTQRGQIYTCSTTSCSEIPVQSPPFAVNMSLGLTMTSDPTTQNTMACGPTIPKDCKSITMYNGICFEISRTNGVGNPVPSSLENCRTKADIAFLLDGSGSVRALEFEKMKDFVKSLIHTFLGKDTQFAISQFSSRFHIHSYFNTFDANRWETDIDNIGQLNGATHTTTAITRLVNEIFIQSRGSRSNVKRVLIVITDGESNDRGDLSRAARLAESKGIVRFAIGVGNAFSNNRAKKELDTIASSPSTNYVFQVESFEALEKIRQTLQDRIFSIEGSQTSGDTLEMEMSQEGFSAAYVPGGKGILMGIVGANQWKGGYLQYGSRGTKDGSYQPANMVPDSYLGYSMAVAKTKQGQLTIVGAPRFQHRGAVITVRQYSFRQQIEPFQFQSGEYFGAEVCAMDLDGDTYTDLVLISAPMHMDPDREGRVYVCGLSGLSVDCHFVSPSVLRGQANGNGRFGSSLAVLPDLNGDNVRDLVVGAPLEDDGQGSIYIFQGEGGGRISPAYSQRITGSEVGSGLKFFGMSISQSSFDLSKDNLPDLAVGSKGKVVLLRSKPIVMMETKVSYTPNQISPQDSDCSVPQENTAKICFTMTSRTVTTAKARIECMLTLDATRKAPNNRAYIGDKKTREQSRSVDLDLQGSQCITVKFSVEACPEDALNALDNELKFTFYGVPSASNLSPSLAQQAKTTAFHPLGFEINCGTDNNCTDNLKVDFNFTTSSEVKVGIDELLNVTVSLENRGENSYNSRVILTYPPGLSFRKFTILQGRIECNSLDSEDGLSQGNTDCTVDKPILKSKTKAFFIVSYGIETNSQLGRKISVTANATSGNSQHSSSNELHKMKEIDVKYSIFVTVESSLSYNNFTFGKSDLQKPVEQSIMVTNDIRALNLTVVIRVPVKLGAKDIWVDSSSLQYPGCQKEEGDEKPPVTDFVAQIQKNNIVDCSVAWCRVFKCSRFMGRVERKNYMFSANLSSGWIEQIGLESAKFLLTSTATLEYDRNQYIFFSTGSNYNPPVRKIVAEVEVYPEPDFTKAIVGGSLGGLALLALLTAGLYKAGFFKSKYSQMINDAGSPEADGDASAPEEEI